MCPPAKRPRGQVAPRNVVTLDVLPGSRIVPARRLDALPRYFFSSDESMT
jgi:hypothetical protein